ncbi:MAG: hypothetical protein HY369_03400, partial [Candidatus Aenigmarchaeota archaeon]|nr:hypothetical protein [Candidatus Aenigmarchaeota archaeon]
VLLYTMLSTLPVTPPKIHGMKLLLSASTLLGVVFASLVAVPEVVQTGLLGVVIGTLLFTVIGHSLPVGRHGKPLYFILGTVAYSLFILAAWALVPA